MVEVDLAVVKQGAAAEEPSIQPHKIIIDESAPSRYREEMFVSKESQKSRLVTHREGKLMWCNCMYAVYCYALFIVGKNTIMEHTTHHEGKLVW